MTAGGGFFGAQNVVLEIAKGLLSTRYRPIIGVMSNVESAATELLHHAQKRGIETVVFNCDRQVDLGTVSDMFQLRNCSPRPKINRLRENKMPPRYIAKPHKVNNVPQKNRGRPLTCVLKMVSVRWGAAVVLSFGVRKFLTRTPRSDGNTSAEPPVIPQRAILWQPVIPQRPILWQRTTIKLGMLGTKKR